MRRIVNTWEDWVGIKARVLPDWEEAVTHIEGLRVIAKWVPVYGYNNVVNVVLGRTPRRFRSVQFPEEIPTQPQDGVA